MQKTLNIKPKQFQTLVLNWFDQHGRKDLPWQQNKTPYRVWVSEIMLQQTQVSTVIPYFLRFMERFPSIHTLANATEDEVLHLWTGLGYYSRARNLLRSAKTIQECYQGQFPDTLDELMTLPGIGRSTAGAISAIAFGNRAAILDGNVKRVLTRFYGIEKWPGEKEVIEQLWKYSETLTPQNRSADYTQAMMDIGATVCTRSKPHCDKCPLTKHCLAYALGMEKALPHPKPSKTLPARQATLLILHQNATVLLEKRPSTGIWGGLWSLPEIPDQLSLTEIKKYCRYHFKQAIEKIEYLDSFRHTFSHFHLDITPALICVKKPKTKVMEDTQQIWYNLHKPAEIGLPAPIRLLLSKLR